MKDLDKTKEYCLSELSKEQYTEIIVWLMMNKSNDFWRNIFTFSFFEYIRNDGDANIYYKDNEWEWKETDLSKTKQTLELWTD